MAVDKIIPEPASLEGTLNEELLALVARQARITPVPSIFAMGIIAVMSSWHLPVWITGSWMLLVIIIVILRWLVLLRLPELARLTVKQRLRIAIGLTTAITGIYALSLGFFPFLGDFERAIQTLMFIGISSISIITTAGYRPISLSYFILNLVPLFILWGWYPDGDITTTNLSIAIIGILYCLMLYKASSDTFRMFVTSFESRQQLAVLNRRLRSTLAQAESASQAKTRFLASASHDLRQPIHSMSLFNAALNMQALNHHTRAISRHMNTALAALASQLDALLDISKLDAGIEPVNHSNVNLCLLLARLVHEFTLSAMDKGLELKLSAPPYSYVHTDEMLFERIIRNLLSNAIKYTERGSIELVVSQSGSKYLLKIIDTGAGIAEGDQSKIFEEFYQLHNPGRDHSRGLGLGLSIVRRLVDLLAIELLMSSAVDKGTTFTLMLEQVKTRPVKEQGLI